jgi:hypothetical protein
MVSDRSHQRVERVPLVYDPAVLSVKDAILSLTCSIFVWVHV